MVRRKRFMISNILRFERQRVQHRRPSAHSSFVIRHSRLLWAALAVSIAVGTCHAAGPDIVLADFEGTNYGRWKATGAAFGDGPARGTLANQQKVTGFLGQGLVNTY